MIPCVSVDGQEQAESTGSDTNVSTPARVERYEAWNCLVTEVANRVRTFCKL